MAQLVGLLSKREDARVALRTCVKARAWQCMFIIPALGSQRQGHLWSSLAGQFSQISDRRVQ